MLFYKVTDYISDITILVVIILYWKRFKFAIQDVNHSPNASDFLSIDSSGVEETPSAIKMHTAVVVIDRSDSENDLFQMSPTDVKGSKNNRSRQSARI